MLRRVIFDREITHRVSGRAAVRRAVIETLEGRRLLHAGHDPSSAYLGAPFPVGAAPVTIQAEDYDLGGEGVAYHDTTPTNTAGAYRTGVDEGVDLKPIPNTTGQYRISDAYVGEWVEYSIDVQQAGTYTLELRVSNADPNAKLHVDIDGLNVTGAVTVPDTNSFNTFSTVSRTIELEAGARVLRLSFDVGAGPSGSVAGVDWMRLTHVEEPPPPPPPGSTSPFHGVAFPVGASPVTIQAEDYDLGGEGAAYHDTTPTNTAGAYRTSSDTGVDLKSIPNVSNQYRISDAYVGEWVEYSIDVQQAGTYTLDLRLSNSSPNAKLHVEIDGLDVTGAVTVPDTNSFNTFSTVSRSIELEAGAQSLRLAFDVGAGSSGSVAGVDWMRLTQIEEPPPPGAQLPYGGVPFAVGATPVTIQAENYDLGGEGVAYHDTTATNTAGAYRTGSDTGVDLKSIPNVSSQYRISDAYVGEWVEYSLNVQQSGAYTLELRLSNSSPNAQLHVEIDGLDVTGAVTVPDTSNFNTFSTVSRTIHLDAGARVLRLAFDVGAGSSGSVAGVDWLRLTKGELPVSGVATWQTVAPAPTIHVEANAAVVGGKLYLLGRFDALADASARSDVYNPATNTWTRIADLPEPTTHAGTAVDGTTIYLAGGFVGDDPGPTTRHVWKYDTLTNTWSAGPDLPGSRGAGVLVRVGRALHFMGGVQSDRVTDSSSHWRLDLDDVAAGWISAPALPNPRNHLAGVALGNKLYVIGGQHGHDEEAGNQDDVHVYDTVSETWSQAADLPTPRGHIAASTIVRNGRIVVIGGYGDGPVSLRDVVEYDPASNTWVALTPLPAARKSPIAGLIGNEIIVSGGQLRGSSPSSTTWKINLPGRWVTGPSMPAALGEVAGGIIDNKLYLFGEGTSSTYVYNLSTATWSTVKSRPDVGNHHAVEVIDGKLYVFGGLDAGDGKVQIYDPLTNNWSEGADIPFATGSTNTCVIDGQVYLAGGIVNFVPGVGGTSTASAARYNPATDTWTMLPSMPQALNHAAAATDGEKFYIFGGRTGAGGVDNGVATVQVYDPATNSWSSSLTGAYAPLPQARGGMGKAVFHDGEFYVIGGETRTGGGATADDVYDRVDIYNPITNTWRLGNPMPTARHGVFPLLHAGRIYVAGGGVVASASQSTILEIYEPL